MRACGSDNVNDIAFEGIASTILGNPDDSAEVSASIATIVPQAIGNAISNARAGLRSELVNWNLLNLSGTMGGFTQVCEIKATISASDPSPHVHSLRSSDLAILAAIPTFGFSLPTGTNIPPGGQLFLQITRNDSADDPTQARRLQAAAFGVVAINNTLVSTYDVRLGNAATINASDGTGPGRRAVAVREAAITLGSATLRVSMPAGCFVHCSTIDQSDWRVCSYEGEAGNGESRFRDPNTNAVIFVRLSVQ